MTTYKKVQPKLTQKERKSPYIQLSQEEAMDLIKAGFRIKSKGMLILPQ